MTDEKKEDSSPVAIGVDLSHWKMKDIHRWQDCAGRGDFLAMNEIMAGVVTSWPYTYDPAEIDSYGELKPAEWAGVAMEVGNAVAESFQIPQIADQQKRISKQRR